MDTGLSCRCGGKGARAPGVGLPLGLSTRGDWPEGWQEGIRIHQPGWDSYSPCPEGRVEAGGSHTQHGSSRSAGGLGHHRCPGDTSVDPSTVRDIPPPPLCWLDRPSLALQPSKPPPWPRQTPQQGGPQSTGPSLAPCGDPGFKSFSLFHCFYTNDPHCKSSYHLSPKTLPHLPHHPRDSCVL